MWFCRSKEDDKYSNTLVYVGYWLLCEQWEMSYWYSNIELVDIMCIRLRDWATERFPYKRNPLPQQFTVLIIRVIYTGDLRTDQGRWQIVLNEYSTNFSVSTWRIQREYQLYLYSADIQLCQYGRNQISLLVIFMC